MNENNGRPEWAQGPEWEGWRWNPHAREMYRPVNSGSVQIEPDNPSDPVLWVVGDSATNYIKVDRLASALAIANLIAEDRGGWA